MSRKLLLSTVLLGMLLLSACGKDGGVTDPGGNDGGGNDGGVVPGAPVNDDPVDNGGWPDPDGHIPAPEPIDTAIYAPADTGSAGTGGTSTALLFQVSGSARYNLGTCGPNGTWTDPLGHRFGPHNPNCLAYKSDGEVGNNNKGECVTSPEGYPGLWLNPQGHPTSSYSSKCLQLGTADVSLTLSFPAQAVLFVATDGSGSKILNFTLNGVTQAQLIYHGTADGTTKGAGVLVGTDSHFRTWSIGFAQPALNYSGGALNDDLISALQSPGVEVVTCSTSVGCSLVMLKTSGL
jgi:hypothetical protein